ncbi:MAG: hypothetical protein ABII79_05575 [bacterium]
MQTLPDDLEGRADNVGDVVVVRLKGEEKRVKEFYNQLRSELPNNPLVLTQLSTIPNIIIKTERSYNRLQCEQMGKFVDIGIEMRDAMNEGFKDVKNTLKDLPKDLAKAIKES